MNNELKKLTLRSFNCLNNLKGSVRVLSVSFTRCVIIVFVIRNLKKLVPTSPKRLKIKTKKFK